MLPNTDLNVKCPVNNTNTEASLKLGRKLGRLMVSKWKHFENNGKFQKMLNTDLNVRFAVYTGSEASLKLGGK